ncbi:amino acid transporter [Thelephora terrestris]|uniref:Amino acid transporter n=1 Tax=Thelephora terrestris TaxID=56493 RepID=A0A9P6L9Z2_9AGAM|nr:amino acid transporter [Thelephora terrestris]
MPADTEREPLLSTLQGGDSTSGDGRVKPAVPNYYTGEAFDNVPTHKRKLGLTSAIFLIFNRMIGTGIFATPSVILRSAGSVGMALTMWLLGAVVAATGSAVYLEYGTTLPRNGGEKNYLEYVYRHPKFLATCVYAMYGVFIGWASANAVVFGEYLLHALDIEANTYNVRGIAFGCLTLSFIMHSCFMTAGLRLQNTLGFFKLLILISIVIIGMAHLAGVPGFELEGNVEVPDNLRWSKMWEGSGNGATAFVTGLYNVIWSFIGYSNANYVLSEIRDPVRTIKRADPIALVFITVTYLLANIAYFGAVSKNDILGSGRIIAALFFRNIFGQGTERVLSVIIALSTWGNNLAALFTHGRLIQELGREGILPWSSFFASDWPFRTPMAGLFVQWVVSSVYVLLPPPGDAYLFVLTLSSYPLSLINTLISAGLLYIHSRPQSDVAQDWNPPFRAYKAAIWFFFASNVFLVVVPFVPPAPGYQVFERIPYYLHCVVGLAIGFVGALYWYIKVVYLPHRGGYELEAIKEEEDGISRTVLKRVPL